MGHLDELRGKTVYLDSNLFIYAVEGFTEHADFTAALFAAIDRAILIEAARLRSSLRIRLPNAIHVATAMLAACELFLTNDQRIRTPDPLPSRMLG